MSCEKDGDNGDRRGLVEEGAAGPADKPAKELRDPVEAQWVCHPIVKAPVAVQPVRPIKEPPALPEVI